MTNMAQICIPMMKVIFIEAPVIGMCLIKHARRKGTQKYLKERCSHRIKYTTATFLAAFMWRRLLNSAALATATHRKPERVSDGRGTRVRAQMINKYRVKMVH